MITTTLNPVTKILETTFSGDVTCQEIVDYIIATKNNKIYPRDLIILTDATNAKMVFGPDDIEKIVKANNQSLIEYNSITDALIVKNPNETALVIFFKVLSENDKYSINAFATKASALQWLKDCIQQ